ncbi:MAG: Wzz/FepE/Etk N-terminal domain-containing protein [Deltaproteobacteria bacterium]|nr:Wzz/FepE/Etk N-terminal domain-containing protein [Deltaproteobacteria bacterium]
MEEKQTQQLEEEINLLDLWRVIWKRKILISFLVVTTVFSTGLYSLYIKDIYSSKAVIAPISSKEGGGGGLSVLAQQFGGLPGISLPGSSSSSEIVNLLKSNILREKVIESYNLLPVLFPEQWDEEKGAWRKEEKGEKKGFGLGQIIHKLVAAIKPKTKKSKPKTEDQNDGSPTTWDGLRSLNGIVAVTNNMKENTITVSIELYDSEMSAKMVDYILTALNGHMRGEAKRVAQTNRMYLEEQLGMTADPLIRQKIYSLIATQIETAMMSEVKENFAFKVIDPPRAPDKKIKPKRSQMVMLSLVASLFAGIFVAFFLEYINKVRRQGEGTR